MEHLKGSGIRGFEDKIQVFFKGKPIKKAYLFGSFAQKKATKDSDIDILVELDPTKTIGMIEFIKMSDGLETIFKRKVDLVTTDGLSPYILPFVDKEKILIYEA
jgi:uncharacterized protein